MYRRRRKNRLEAAVLPVEEDAGQVQAEGDVVEEEDHEDVPVEAVILAEEDQHLHDLFTVEVALSVTKPKRSYVMPTGLVVSSVCTELAICSVSCSIVSSVHPADLPLPATVAHQQVGGRLKAADKLRKVEVHRKEDHHLEDRVAAQVRLAEQRKGLRGVEEQQHEEVAAQGQVEEDEHREEAPVEGVILAEETQHGHYFPAVEAVNELTF
ncbi:hypothetical protein TYRP_011533 [Tyrophagus putrescentiae]|nr:hypothetical protein TYRP_011533 [Tyrophagus putrescentiae]